VWFVLSEAIGHAQRSIATKGRKSQYELLYLKSGSPEVDQQRIAAAGRSKVAEYLRGVFAPKCFARFQLDDQAVFNEEVGEKLADGGPVFVIHPKRHLTLDRISRLAEPVPETCFVHPLEVAVTKIGVQSECNLPDLVAELSHCDFIAKRRFLFCAACALWGKHYGNDANREVSLSQREFNQLSLFATKVW
jgi:hypothetical protein